MAAPVARRQRTNPFYVVLVAAGIAFFVTASAYCLMAFRADRRGRSYTTALHDRPASHSPVPRDQADSFSPVVHDRPVGVPASAGWGGEQAKAGTPTVDRPRAAAPANSSLLSFLERRGGWLMAGELAVLALASLAAMGTDRFWSGEQTGMENDNLR
jgi:hypothetical protein